MPLDSPERHGPPSTRSVYLATCWWHGPSSGRDLQYTSVFRRELTTLWDALQAEGLVQVWRLEGEAVYVAGYRVFHVLCVVPSDAAHGGGSTMLHARLVAHPACIEAGLHVLYAVPDWVPQDAPLRALSVNAWPR